LDWASEVSLLILDDLGAQNETDWAVSKLEWLIGERFSQGKCTIITTNLTQAELEKLFGPRVVDRLAERALYISLVGHSLRKRNGAVKVEMKGVE